MVISIGKGVARKAVTRNLLKRRIRAVMRPILKEKEGYFSVIARPGAAEATFADIKREILESIK
ncbi:MAG TPA: ribonuclease P protein component [Candidatus Paceibacterota bacterium]|nr:ribonuclease P protein component [Candidatus Paceibacterota bacterium]